MRLTTKQLLSSNKAYCNMHKENYLNENFYKDLITSKFGKLLPFIGDDFAKYRADEKAQGPIGRLGTRYKEAGIATLLAPYMFGPAAVANTSRAQLRRMGVGTKAYNIQYGGLDGQS